MSLRIETKEDVNYSLSALFDLIGSYKKLSFQISIDEFQQISSYESTSVIDATLRGFFHKAPNVHFLFSGSQEHILLDLFGSPTRPLYASVEKMKLGKIGYSDYFDFISSQFTQHGKSIEDIALHEVIQWTQLHTYYTQNMANKLFGSASQTVDEKKLYTVKNSILLENEPYYLQIRAMISAVQYRLLSAIATEGKAEELTSTYFLSKYGLSGASVLKATKALLKYDLIYRELDLDKNFYAINDVFMYHWLREKGYYARKL